MKGMSTENTYTVTTDLTYARTDIFKTTDKTEATDWFSRRCADAEARGGMVMMWVDDTHKTTAIFNKDGSSRWQYGSKLEWHHKAAS